MTKTFVRSAASIFVVVFPLFFTTAVEANAMGKMCLFSAVKGVVLDHGKPVEGATIERSYKWMWNDQVGVDKTVTDAQGRSRCRRSGGVHYSVRCCHTSLTCGRRS